MSFPPMVMVTSAVSAETPVTWGGWPNCEQRRTSRAVAPLLVRSNSSRPNRWASRCG